MSRKILDWFHLAGALAAVIVMCFLSFIAGVIVMFYAALTPVGF